MKKRRIHIQSRIFILLLFLSLFQNISDFAVAADFQIAASEEDLLVYRINLDGNVSYAKFVIHYLDGTTLVEDRKDGYSWDNAPKENIIALGIIYDPIATNVREKESNQLICYELPEYVLRGSKKYKYGYFQFKTADQPFAIRRGKDLPPKKVLNLSVGIVVDKEGHCVVLAGRNSGSPITYYTTIESLKLNLELFNIKLEEIGEERS